MSVAGSHDQGSTLNVLKSFDEAKMQGFHWRTVFTAGMGFFTDAYDLFIIGTVTAILTPIWGLTAGNIAILNSTSLAAAALWALFFGRLMDRFGRKAMYGVEMTMLTFGAILCAFAPSFGWLVAFRVLVGFGVGGDYPTSSVLMSEYSNRTNRGLLVTMVFAMQGLGLLIGPLVAAALLSTSMPHEIVWRVMLGLGAIPAASVIYLRRKTAETPRYLAVVKGDMAKAGAVVSSLTNTAVERAKVTTQKVVRQTWNKRNLIRLIGTAGSWFLLDIAFYGNGVSSQLILKALLPGAALVTTTLVAAAIFLIAAIPGYLVAAKYMDKLGRKAIQLVGFVIMALAYGALFLAPGIAKLPILFLIIYGVSYFFIEFGPNTTTFIVPAEVFPTNLRGSGHGMSAAAGKVGAFLGAFFLPVILAASGLPFTMGLLAGVALLGVLLTALILPEMRGHSLDETEEFAPATT